MKITRLQDIAEKVKVSKTAVSKVLNNIPIRISPEKRNSIIHTAKKLNYRPNIIAKSLRDKTTKTIGIVVPDMSTHFYPEIIKSIETRLSSFGYQTIICNSEDNADKEKDCIENLLNRIIDALVLVPAGGNGNIKYLQNIHKSSLPFILIDRYFTGEAFRYVAADNYEGAKKAAEMLIKNGVKTFYYLGSNVRNQTLDDRLAGLRAGLKEASVEFGGANIVLCSSQRSVVKEAGIKILGNDMHNACVFMESNRYTAGLLDATKEKKLRVPDDFIIAGFDPFEPEVKTAEDFENLKILGGPILTIKQPIEKIGALAGEYLVSSLGSNGDNKKKWQLKLPVDMSV
ncbi:MAG: hypothetical protein A2252_06110 [Elusimicrobia bacterium RIFOXYA2_FULL_39_19]|nr:MAG: hypothetical protein A2252_06110 [Elusimicrobia bacterium RIFOXYA2_FULL_39_19]